MYYILFLLHTIFLITNSFNWVEIKNGHNFLTFKEYFIKIFAKYEPVKQKY